MPGICQCMSRRKRKCWQRTISGDERTEEKGCGAERASNHASPPKPAPPFTYSDGCFHSVWRRLEQIHRARRQKGDQGFKVSGRMQTSLSLGRASSLAKVQSCMHAHRSHRISTWLETSHQHTVLLTTCPSCRPTTIPGYHRSITHLDGPPATRGIHATGQTRRGDIYKQTLHQTFVPSTGRYRCKHIGPA